DSTTVNKLFEEFMKWNKYQSGNHILCVRSNNGTEYSKMKKILKKKGIEHQVSVTDLSKIQ
ncbi:hypothetical protein HMI54_011683, partial [Coelomomyces lativittatus]